MSQSTPQSPRVSQLHQDQPESNLVEIEGVSRSFGGVHALKSVSLRIRRGEVHALVGENGAGKSTLIKVLAGSCHPDEGTVTIDGHPLQLGSVRASEAAGIAVIHQEPTAFPNLSAEDNVFVGHEIRRHFGLFLDHREMRRRTVEALARLGQTLPTSIPVAKLSMAQRQMVSIARALVRECKLLIMDEPTASLSYQEKEALFAVVRQLRSEGVSLIYVSHHLSEVFDLADRITVLRDGAFVSTLLTQDTTTDDLIRLMVGREVGESNVARSDASQPERAVALDVRGLTREGAFSDVSFRVREGEVLGVGGLVGAGRSEVTRAVFGIDTPDSGEVIVHGTPLRPGSIPAAVKAGLALVPEDRQIQGLVLPMSVRANLTMAIHRHITRFGLVSSRIENETSDRMISDLRVRAAGSWVAAETLSGGNQQKVALAKWLATTPGILLLDEPTRGVDVGAKSEFHHLIRELSAKGMAVVVVSSDLPELLALSDRIIVMRKGEVVGELDGASATQEQVLRLALGADRDGGIQ